MMSPPSPTPKLSAPTPHPPHHSAIYFLHSDSKWHTHDNHFPQQYTTHFFDPPPPPPPPTPKLVPIVTVDIGQSMSPLTSMSPPSPTVTPVPIVTVDIGQSIPQSPPSNLSNGPAPSNIIAAESSPIICFNSITRLIRELELGKSLFNIGAPITIAVLTSNDSKKFRTTFTYLMLSALSIGFMAIWNGIALRTTFPRTADVVEQLGILMVLLSFTGLLGSALPPEFMCEKSFKRQE